MRFSFLPTELYAILFFIFGIIAVFIAIKYRNNKKYLISMSISSIVFILAALRKLIKEKYIISNYIFIVELLLIILGIIAIIPLVIDFIQKTKDKPELRKMGKIGLLIMLIGSLPMIILAIILYFF